MAIARFPYVDARVPVAARRREARESAEDAIVLGKDREPGAERGVGGGEPAGAELEIAETIVEPRDLLARQVVAPIDALHGRAQEPSSPRPTVR